MAKKKGEKKPMKKDPKTGKMVPAFLKMKKGSMAKKELVGKQKNLNEGLKRAIKAAPKMKKAAMMLKKEEKSGMMMKKAAMKLKKDGAMMMKKAGMMMKKSMASMKKASAMKMKMKSMAKMGHKKK